MKLLYILNVAKRVNNFSYSSMIAAQELGIEFHIAGNWGYESDAEREADEKKYGIRIFQVNFERNPLSPKNIKAYKQLVSIMQSENYDAVHTNTPIGGLAGRLAAKKCNIKKVIYQAHGFHFYKGAPLLNWVVYYPIERFLAHFTDALITINKEDYEIAKSFNLRGDNSVYYVPGVGINTAIVENKMKEKTQKRTEFGLSDEDVMLLSVGELNENKNHEIVIRALSEIPNNNIHYYIAGKGDREEQLKNLANDLGVSNRVHLLGFRDDISEILMAADIFCFPSFREGLSVALMEAMANAMPCVASNIRGNVDLIKNGEGGYLCSPYKPDEFREKIEELCNDNKKRIEMGAFNLDYVKSFSSETIQKRMILIYQEVLNNEIS